MCISIEFTLGLSFMSDKLVGLHGLNKAQIAELQKALPECRILSNAKKSGLPVNTPTQAHPHWKKTTAVTFPPKFRP